MQCPYRVKTSKRHEAGCRGSVGKNKKLAGRWWVYGAVALGVGGSSAPLPEQNASLGASPFEQSLNEGSRRLENKLKISEMKKRAEAEKQFVSPLRPHAEEQTFADWNMIAGNLQEIPWAEENVQQKRLKSVAGQWVRRLREICLWLS